MQYNNRENNYKIYLDGVFKVGKDKYYQNQENIHQENIRLLI
jgi:hypothetical protein